MSEPSYFIDTPRLDPEHPSTMECPECWRTKSCLSTVCQCGFHLANFRKEQLEILEKHKLKSRNKSRKRFGFSTILTGIVCIVLIEWQGFDVAWQLLPCALIAAGIALLCTLTKARL